MPFLAAIPAGIAALGGALAGGIGGALGSSKTTEQTSGINMAPASALENQGSSTMGSSLAQFGQMVNAGPGQSDITNSANAQRSLADMFQQYSQSGGLPSQGDINSSNGIAQQMFAPQQVGMQQAFTDQTINANRQAALMGRSMNDPILAAKLATEQTRQQAMLGAQQGQFAQQYALQLPQQRLQYAQQGASVLDGLATQAMKNRIALASMGESAMSDERNFRIQSGQRVGTSTEKSGGGIGGAISGALGGAGAIGSGLMNLFGGGGSSGSGGGSSQGMSLGSSMPSFSQTPSNFWGMSGGATSSFGGSALGSQTTGLNMSQPKTSYFG
jgi:hypothetical protein